MSGFSYLLWRALWEVNLFSVPELYVRCQAAVQERGRAERLFLVDQIGETNWQRLLAVWGLPDAEAQAVTQLGVGAVLTEFFVAPVPLAYAGRGAIARLGTVANLLIGIYDDLVDAGAVQDPLSQRTLQALLLGQKMSLGEAPPLVVLADEYFRQLAMLPEVDARPQVVRTLRHAIVKMYAAERTTLDARGHAARMAGWQRKSALPFVVMALPAWLVATGVCPSAYCRHLRWLCRCGVFWGWVDDAVDLDDDATAGHPNRVGEALDREAPPVVAARIAEQGPRVLADWRQITPHSAGLPLAVQEALPTCLFAVLGHSLSRTRKEVSA
ncbi:MAG: hypothetical protein JO250_16970 [Armatimonadetes bacterium]|nr:hypothetical protein [Armatimonadota bacterium]